MLFQRPDVALACARVLGVPTARVGQGFLCILPNHDERRPSASLHWDPKTGALMYRGWHARSGVEWYTLPDVRASLACGQVMRLRGPSVATWQLRLLVEARILEPYVVPARPLPSDVRPAVRKVYRVFASCSPVSGGTPQRYRRHSRGALPPRGAGSGSGMSATRCSGSWRRASSVRWGDTATWRSSCRVTSGTTQTAQPAEVCPLPRMPWGFACAMNSASSAIPGPMMGVIATPLHGCDSSYQLYLVSFPGPRRVECRYTSVNVECPRTLHVPEPGMPSTSSIWARRSRTYGSTPTTHSRCCCSASSI
jgi:hypothetical protein